jgi:hypothetical protein
LDCAETGNSYATRALGEWITRTHERVSVASVIGFICMAALIGLIIVAAVAN